MVCSHRPREMLTGRQDYQTYPTMGKMPHSGTREKTMAIEIPEHLARPIRAWMEAEGLSEDEALAALGRIRRPDVKRAKVLMSMSDKVVTVYPPVMFTDKEADRSVAMTDDERALCMSVGLDPAKVAKVTFDDRTEAGEGVSLIDAERETVKEMGYDPDVMLKRERERAGGAA